MAAIKSVEVRVQSSIKSVEVGGGIPGSPGTDGTDGVSITGASIDGSGHLILTLSSGGPIDVGLVVGADGTDGTDGADGVSITGATVNGSGHLILSLSTGGTVDAGLVVGADGTDGTDGTDGADGVSITGATVDGSYNLILSLSTGGTINAGYVRGPAGADGTGTGDVVGVAPSVAGNFAAYTDTTGKEIEDSGVGPADFATATQGGKADTAVQPGDFHAASAKATPVDADELALWDSAASWAQKNLTFGNLKTWIKSWIVKADVGLGNVDNTSDTNKPVSTAQQTALDLKAPLASPTFTGTPLVPTASGGTNTQQAASTAFVATAIAALLDSAPGTLDTLNELAAALGDDPNFATTITNALAGKQPLDSDLTALAALATAGMIVRTGAGAVAARTLTGTANEITVTDGDGVSSNPTMSLPTVAKPYGKQAIPIPAGAMKARTTNGAASGSVEMTTNKNMFVTLDFDTSTQEFAQFSIAMPKSWNESTVTFVPVWSHASTTTNFGVVWSLAGVAVSNDDAGDVAFGTAQTSSDTGGTTNDIYFGPESSAITIAGTPAANDLVMFQIARVPSDGSDTMAIDARLHGITLYITTDAGNDA